MRHYFSACLLICFITACQTHKKNNGLSPQEALASFKIADGFKIELVASEPMISDPVAMEADENGNIYVIEMHGYPMDTTGAGVVKLLTDTDHDGMPDKSVVFADHLHLPTGVMRWKKGLLVVDVPDILYLEDSNNDGKADIRQTVITGLALTNPQHIANTPMYGLDNWIYVAHMGIVTPKVAIEFSDTGSNVRYATIPEAKQLPRNADGRNIRFKPATHELEMLSGESQYGQTFDNWGHHLGTSNADHLFHEVIAARYLQRNSDLPVSDASEHIPDHGQACEVYPVTINPEHQLLTDVGVITSSCGVTWYQGGLFPDSFNHITFIAEPVHNLVHADRITDHGASFIASRVYEKKEFLASTDAWCRPVQFYIGPDGAMYVIDYYREIIEHPEWMSDSVNNSGELYNGSDKGRIWRVTPTGAAKMDWCSNTNLGKASTAQLVKYLESSNIWWRRNAQRLLVDRHDTSAVFMLRSLLSTTASAAASVHALWTLEALQASDSSVLRKALHHAEAGVRENAIQIAELHGSEWPALAADLLSLQNDPDAKVRYQLLCTLGNFNTANAETARQNILVKDIEDKWVQIAALSASAGKEYRLIEKSIPVFSGKPSDAKRLFFQNCAAVIGLAKREVDIKKLITLAAAQPTNGDAWWQSACLDGLAQAIHNKGALPFDLQPQQTLLLAKFNTAAPAAVRSSALDLLTTIGVQKNAAWTSQVANAKKAAADRRADASYRKDALHLLALDKDAAITPLLDSLISPEEPEAVQSAALNVYNELNSPAACIAILRHWKTLTHDLRDAAMDIFLSSPENMKTLLNAVQDKTIQVAAISWPRRVQLMQADDEAMRKQARQLLVSSSDDRDAVYARYKPALELKGDAAKGLAVFQKTCATCHQVGSQYGRTFGPDLGTIRNREPQFIMADILNPNRSIADHYENWTVIKKNGDKLSGLMSSETSTAVTLKDATGKETIISRADIKSMEASDISVMPVGLEASVSVNEMADLLAFLKGIH